MTSVRTLVPFVTGSGSIISAATLNSYIQSVHVKVNVFMQSIEDDSGKMFAQMPIPSRYETGLKMEINPVTLWSGITV
jgi:hypothetical protein